MVNIISEKFAATLEEMMNEAKNILANNMAARDKARSRISPGMKRYYNEYEYKRLSRMKKKVDEFAGDSSQFEKLYKRIKSYKPRSLSLKKNLAGIGVGTIMGKFIKPSQPETKGL